MQLRPGELPLLQQAVQQLCGVALDDSKGYLIENRLGPLAERFGCGNFNELYFKLRYGGDSKLTQEVVDAITTHETSWFRDAAPFEALQFKVGPESLDARARAGTPKKLRIWSAAASTGQESYSIGMVLCDIIPDIAGWDIQILGTDISKASIATAEKAVYAEHEVARTARPQSIQKYMERTAGGWRVKDQVRRLCQFRQFNLMDPMSTLGPFDIVWIRNVLIYFDKPARADIMRRVRSTLLPHGWLFVGATENLVDLGPEWVPQAHCRATVYQPNLPLPMPVRR
ncbi:MAG: protein-glutamate O-methyltransferase CheR [Planctomycetes bacterium]|nr:protein-glutamate O-methyltransferase CheR [Planctomycetota bacterium]